MSPEVSGCDLVNLRGILVDGGKRMLGYADRRQIDATPAATANFNDK